MSIHLVRKKDNLFEVIQYVYDGKTSKPKKLGKLDIMDTKEVNNIYNYSTTSDHIKNLKQLSCSVDLPREEREYFKVAVASARDGIIKERLKNVEQFGSEIVDDIKEMVRLEIFTKNNISQLVSHLEEALKITNGKKDRLTNPQFYDDEL